MSADPSHQQIGQDIGAKIRAARLAKKYTQSQLANPGFTVSYVSAIERGQLHPSLRALEIFAQRLGLSSTDLLSKQTPQEEIDRTQPYEARDTSLIPIRITENPLTPQNLAIVLTSLTELTTKFWLIAKRRFDDLIEYTQTHDIRFAQEAGTVITKIKYNSPFNFDWKVDISAPSVAEAIGTTIDAIKQRYERQKKLELENLAAAQKLIEAEQKAEQEQQMAALEREKQELELEKQKLEIEKERQELVEQRLEAQKKQIEDALEVARKAVDIVYPNVDAELRSVLIQTVMNNILQLQNVTGLELALPAPRKRRK